MFKELKKSKDHFIQYLKKKNIMAQQHYIPIYEFSIYKEKVSDFPGSKKYFNNSISIPIFVNLNYRDQNKIIKIIKNYFE